MHCHKTGLGAQCAHPEPRLRAHCVRSAQVVGAAARAADRLRACRAHNQSMSRACWRALVTTCPGSLPQVATSLPCRDIKATRIMSRHQIGVATPFLLPAPNQVATLEPGRDPPGDSPMSRHQFHVATSFPNRPGRDVSSMSRPLGDLTYVATSNPCRDLPHSRPCRDIKSMSRHRFYPQWDFQVTTPKARSRPPTLLPMSRP